MAFAAAVAVGTSVVCGLLPAGRARRLDLVEALADDGAAPVGAGVGSGAARTRSLIMSVQVAIASLLLVGASLLGRSFLALLDADRGYDLTQVLSARLSMPAAMYPAPERRFAIVSTILARLGAAPGVTEAAFTSELPLTPGGSTSALTFRSSRGELLTAQASPRIVSPRYFAALRLRTLAGRVFADGDSEGSARVVVVNESFARRYLREAALGTKLPMAAYPFPDGSPLEATVIGVVGDVRYIGAETRSQPEVYYPYLQMGARLPVQTVTLLARTVGAEDAVAPALVAAVRDADDRLVADVVMPLEARLITTTLARPRLYATLLGGFAAVALTIAGVGLFGLVSYAASLRSRELAIRVALGAPRADVIWMVVRQGVGVVLAGLVAGLGAAAALARLLATHLYGVTAYDLLTFVGVPIVLLAVAAAASVIPARRAATIDPVRVLRGA
jgi:putative ABC transport system permease protein